jgi:polysaccharide biosynthesis protein PslG
MLKGLMTRLVLITTLLVLGLAGPASAKLTVGIGEQDAEMFTDARWKALKAPDVRYVLPWDAIQRNNWELAVFDTYMHRARDANARVLISFGHSTRRGRELKAPTRLQFIREFRKVRRRYPEVKLFQTWNEANHGTQPIWKKPGLAATYYNAMRRTCPECTITAPSVLDAPNMTWYIQRFKARTRYRVKVWALHNHIDANRHRTSGTREMLRVTRRGQLWFTETGGIVNRWVDGRRRREYNQKNAVRAIRNVFKLAKLSKRITRIYLYHWKAPDERRPRWDSGLVDRRGKTRPSLRTFQAQLRRLR